MSFSDPTWVTVYLNASIDKYLNHLWNDLRSRAKTMYFELKGILQERLIQIHNSEYIPEESFNRKL
jgi:hypothetical protein